jgi:hypothetical protein
VKRLLVLLILSAACGGGGGLPTGASPVMTSVLFHYEATAEQREQTVGCHGVARVYPSWWGFTHATMVATDEGRWAALFDNVPVGRQSVRITTPPGCDNPIIVANDVAIEAANDNLLFTFIVHPDGSVSY